MNDKHLKLKDEIALVNSWLNNSDQDSLGRLIEAYTPLIRKVANRHMRDGLNIDDLVNEGIIGFIVGLEKYNPDLGNTLGVFVKYDIINYISKFADGASCIVRIPNSRSERKIKEVIVHCVKNEERLSRDKFGNSDKQSICAQAGIKELQVERYEMARRPAVKISSSDCDGYEVVKEIIDDRDTVEEEVAKRQSIEKAKMVLSDIFDNMHERSRRVITLRYMSDAFTSYDYIATEIGVSRELVRRIERAELENIRKGLKKSGIKEFDDIF